MSQIATSSTGFDLTTLAAGHFSPPRQAPIPSPRPIRDLIAEALRSLELTDWRAGMTTLSPGFALEVPNGKVGFYAIRSGQCWLQLPNERGPIRMSANEFWIVAPQGRHLLYDQESAKVAPIRNLYEAPHSRPAVPTAGSQSVEIVHAHFSDLDLGRTAFHGVLPTHIALRPGKCPTLNAGAALMDCIAEERISSRRGGKTIIERLANVLFLKTLQGFLLDQPEASFVSSQGNWLRAACDPIMGPILGLIHRHPEEPWTVRQLATHSNMAKSAFSEQFHKAVGKPPLQYVTEFRMRRACEMLRATELDIKQIAALVGYESASSFSNAFKRLVKSSPAGYRRQSSRSSSCEDE